MTNQPKVESGVQLFTRINQQPILTGFYPKLFKDSLNAGDIIQICGKPFNGRTALVMELLACCILPSKFAGINLPGKNSVAVLISTDMHFDMFGFVCILERILDNFHSNFKFSSQHKMQVIETSLNNLRILNCYDHHELEMSLHNVRRIESENFNVGLIVINNLFAHYWAFRHTFGLLSMQDYSSKLVEILHNNLVNAVLLYGTEDADDYSKGAVSYRILMDNERSKDVIVWNAERECYKIPKTSELLLNQ